jgi:hypothetical protein
MFDDDFLVLVNGWWEKLQFRCSTSAWHGPGAASWTPTTQRQPPTRWPARFSGAALGIARGGQRAKLARIAEVNRPLYRAYLLKDQLRLVFRVKGPHAVALLDAWLSWARRCRVPAFVQLARTVAAHRDGIVAALLHGLSNARVESVNTKLRVLTRMAFGFRSPQALIGLAMLSVGGLCPDLPGSAQPHPRICQ